MMDWTSSGLFQPWTDPQSGITFQILSKEIAPLQKGFYFVNDCMSADGRYLWFCCAYPPSLVKTLAVIDLETWEVHHFPDTQFSGESPFVAPENGHVYWCVGDSIWTRPPDPQAPATLVNSVPSELIGGRPVHRLATHLTRSADKAEFFVDAGIGLGHIFGTLPIDGSPFVHWHRFDRTHNHAQMSPTDPDVTLFAEEIHRDPITGLTFPITNRLWVIRRGEAPRPILREPRWVSHEWWDDDGEHAWCVWGNETWRVHVTTGEVEVIGFPHHCWHSHCSHDGRLIIGDSNTKFYRGCRSGVHFLNRDTGRLLDIVYNPEMHNYAGRNYHIDPHPRFCSQDRYVVFTTTVRNKVDLAVMETSTLLELTS